MSKRARLKKRRSCIKWFCRLSQKTNEAQQGLAALSGPKQSIDVQGPPQETINQLVNLYNQGQMAAVIEQATSLTEQYPEAFIVWNLLGAANKGLGNLLMPLTLSGGQQS